LRTVSDKFVDKIKTHFIFKKSILEKLAVYEIMCQNMAEPDRSQMKI
jgi:hypothetical protein